MTRLWTRDNDISVQTDAHENLSAFRWQGRTHTIQRIWQCWQVDNDWWSEAGAVSRIYYTLTTKENLLCVIYYDYLQEGWRLAKVYD
jgi:hypothetical protein